MEVYQMEAGEIFEFTTGAFSGHANPATAPAQAERFGPPRFDTTLGSSKKKKKKAKITHQFSEESISPVPAPSPAPALTPTSTSPSVSICYVFKSRLQEYAQKAGFLTPVYETMKEGPSHEPSFRSTVILNDVRYDSLPGFFNRKAAEQSAAEVALIEISNSVDMKFGISLPVHETGLSKNLLQEYSQKMNYAVPLYDCHKEEAKNRMSMYSCTVDIGGTKYIGASASTKKEAEIKAARTALLAIQSAASEDHAGNSVYTVIPQKKKSPDLGISTQGTAAALKPNKGRCKKKKQRKKKYDPKRGKMAAGKLKVKMDGEQAGQELVKVDDVSFQRTNSGWNMETTTNDSNTGFYNAILENSLVPSDGGLYEDGLGVKVLDQADVETDSLVVDMAGQESGVTQVVSSQEKATDVAEELNATNILSCQRTDSGVGHLEIASNNFSTGFYEGVAENALAVSNERLYKDTLDVNTDGPAAVESEVTDAFRSQHDLTDALVVGKAGLELGEIDAVSAQRKATDGSEKSSVTDVVSQGTDSVKQSSNIEIYNGILENVLVPSNEGLLEDRLANALVVDVTEKAGVELSATDAIGSSEKATEDSEELSAAYVVSCQGTDSGLAPMETGTNI